LLGRRHQHPTGKENDSGIMMIIQRRAIIIIICIITMNKERGGETEAAVDCTKSATMTINNSWIQN